MEKKEFKCETCGKVYTREDHYLAHIAKHNQTTEETIVEQISTKRKQTDVEKEMIFLYDTHIVNAKDGYIHKNVAERMFMFYNIYTGSNFKNWNCTMCGEIQIVAGRFKKLCKKIKEETE